VLGTRKPARCPYMAMWEVDLDDQPPGRITGITGT